MNRKRPNGSRVNTAKDAFCDFTISTTNKDGCVRIRIAKWLSELTGKEWEGSLITAGLFFQIRSGISQPRDVAYDLVREILAIFPNQKCGLS